MPTTDTAKAHEVVMRTGFGVMATGLAGIVTGTLRVGSAPAWPQPEIWALTGGVAAIMCVVAVFHNDWAYRGVTIYAVAAVSLFRGLGYAIAPSSRLGFNSAAVGVYVLIIGVLIILWAVWQNRPAPRVPDPTSAMSVHPSAQ